VLDATTNAITARIPVAPWMTEIEVNSVTNQVYVGNPVDRTITVIDGKPGSPTENTVVAVIPLPIYGGGDIAVNEVTNRIYIGTGGYDFQTNKYIPITVIDGSTNTIAAQLLLDELGGSVAVNPKTNTVYSTSLASYRLLVIDGNTNSVSASIDLGEHVHKVAVNPRTNRVHLTNGFGGSLVTIDGATNTYLSRLWLGTYEPIPIYIAVNPQTSYVYTGNIGFNSNFGGQSISVIDDPPNPAEQIRDLIDLVKTYNLSQGIANSLDAKLQRALEALDSVNSGNSPTACNKLASFINEVDVQQQLSPAQATELSNAASRIMRTLGC
jgi:YVTN family beta-propeller protein